MHYDRVYFATATTGTGTITAGAAESDFRTMAGATIPDGTTTEYTITDGTAWETGTGVVGATSTTLTRVLSDSSTGALLSLTGSAKAFITPIASRLNAAMKGTHANQPNRAVGEYLTPQLSALALTTIAAAADRLDYYPFMPAHDVKIDNLDVEVSTAVAASLGRLAIYSDSAGVPGSLLADGAATIDCATTGRKTATITATTLFAANVYWLAILSSATQTYRAIAVGALMPASVTTSLNNTFTGVRQTQAFASGMPASQSGATATASAMPLIKLRIA